jgi:hypothetical protein
MNGLEHHRQSGAAGLKDQRYRLNPKHHRQSGAAGLKDCQHLMIGISHASRYAEFQKLALAMRQDMPSFKSYRGHICGRYF